LAPLPDHCKSSQLAFHQLHFGDHGGVVSLMRYLEGVPDLLGSVQAAHLVVFILSAFRDRGVPGPTSEMSPRAPAQMGRRETEREGRKKGQPE
jgi:hypothetical protein